MTAIIKHFENGDVIKVSTEEWAIKKQLYRTVDTSAYINLGKVLAQRCLESGIVEVYCDIQPQKKDGKVAEFLKAVEEAGLQLTEPPQYKTAYPWTQHREQKPWEVIE